MTRRLNITPSDPSEERFSGEVWGEQEQEWLRATTSYLTITEAEEALERVVKTLARVAPFLVGKGRRISVYAPDPMDLVPSRWIRNTPCSRFVRVALVLEPAPDPVK